MPLEQDLTSTSVSKREGPRFAASMNLTKRGRWKYITVGNARYWPIKRLYTKKQR